MATPQIDVLVYGLGAIGSFYAFILSRNNNVRLTVVARSNYDAVNADGLHITSGNHGEHHVVPFKGTKETTIICVTPADVERIVVKSVAEAGQTFDFIVCAHKAIDQESVPEQIAAGVDPSRTTIAIIQNGVGNEEPFRNRFPTTTIVSCVTWSGCRQPQPGVITHTKSEDMQIGLFPNKDADSSAESSRLQRFAALLETGNTKFQIVPNIQVQRWEKVVWNAAWNPLTTISLLDTHAWLNSSELATPMTKRVMQEVINVAHALEVPVADDLIDRLFARILGMPPIGSSMRADFEAGKLMEVDIILGYPVRKGRELGVDVTTIETLYTLLKAVNKRLAG